MSAAVLREAASLMRERAEAATPGPWEVPASIHGDPFVTEVGRGILRGGCVARASGEDYGKGNSEHIASWHPAVALAVADLLDNEASLIVSVDEYAHLHMPINGARVDLLLVIARAYLGT